MPDDLHRRPAARGRRLARGRPDAGQAHEPRPHAHRQERPARRPTSTRSPTGGTRSQIYGSTEERCRKLRAGEDGKLIDRGRPAARGGRPEARRHRPDRLLRQLLDRPVAAAHAVRQGAQRDLRPPEGRLPDVGRREALPHRAARQLGADGEDPHRRVDAGDPRQPGAGAGDARQLVRRPAALGAQTASATSAREMIGGIVGSEQEHHAAPYSITEEFVSVYRLHPLLPDDYEIRDHRTGALIAETDFDPIQGHGTRAVDRRVRDVEPPLLVRRRRTRARSRSTTTRRALNGHVRLNGDRVDLGHDRHPARPRARRAPLQRLPRRRCASRGSRASRTSPTTRSGTRRSATSTTATSTRVDLQVGLLGEPLPPGFGFSDTAFRIFILMASRRLKSRPLLHQRLHARGLHAGGHRVGRVEHDGRRAPAPPPGAGAGARRREERVRAVEPGRLARRMNVGSIARSGSTRCRAFTWRPGAASCRARRRSTTPGSTRSSSSRTPSRASSAAGAGPVGAATARGRRPLGGRPAVGAAPQRTAAAPVWVRLVTSPALLLLSRRRRPAARSRARRTRSPPTPRPSARAWRTSSPTR